MIVFGLLESHKLLSQASSVRLDSFVYRFLYLMATALYLRASYGIYSGSDLSQNVSNRRRSTMENIGARMLQDLEWPCRGVIKD